MTIIHTHHDQQSQVYDLAPAPMSLTYNGAMRSLHIGVPDNNIVDTFLIDARRRAVIRQHTTAKLESGHLLQDDPMARAAKDLRKIYLCMKSKLESPL
jgi:hypothetical protein